MLQHPEQDPEILHRIVASDEHVFKKVYDALAPSVFNAAMIYTKDENLAQEIVQVTFIRFWEKRHSVAEIHSLENYLFIIARNLIFDHFRKRVRDNRVLTQIQNQSQENAGDADTRLLEREYEELVEAAITHLTPQQQKVYLLSKKEGLDNDQIAARLEISRHTVRKHLELANQFIRQFIKSRITSCITLLMFNS